MLNLSVRGQKSRWAMFGLYLGLLTAPAFQANAAVTYSSVFSFDLSVSSGGVVEGNNQALFGTVTNASLTSGGAIYKASMAGGAPQTIFQLSSDDGHGYTPTAGLLVGSDDYLYGSTVYGARQTSLTLYSGTGTLFRVRQDGTAFQQLHTFGAISETNSVTLGGQTVSINKNADGIYPSFPLIEDSSGYLYGVTSYGGSNGTGVIFRILRDGTGFQVLHSFAAQGSDGRGTDQGNGVEGAFPSGPLLLSNSRLYGVTSNGGSNLYTLETTASDATVTTTTQGTGTVYSLNPDGSDFQTIYNFSALADAADSDSTTSDYLGENGDGAFPSGGLTEVSLGVIVGTAADGGVTSDTTVGGLGTIFQLNTDGTLANTTSTTLHSFDSTTGYAPKGKLMLANDGRLYGVNSRGSSTTDPVLSYGSVFSISTTATTGGDYVVEHVFTTAEGIYPEAGLSKASNGDLFGTTTQAGVCNTVYGSYGSVYRLSFTGAAATGYANCTTYDSGGGSMSVGWLWLLAALGLVPPVRRRLFSFE